MGQQHQWDGASWETLCLWAMMRCWEWCADRVHAKNASPGIISIDHPATSLELEGRPTQLLTSLCVHVSYCNMGCRHSDGRVEGSLMERGMPATTVSKQRSRGP
jgi:hypothetical protein